MSRARLNVIETADEIGSVLGNRLLSEIDRARAEGRRYVLGCPTGRTPKPIYGAIGRRLSTAPQDLSHVVLAMMDEYVIERRENAPADKPWSCHYFARHEIIRRWNEHLPKEFQLAEGNVWFPDPVDPEQYEARIEEAGGIDFFVLASGASDGHVAFNPPASPRESRTRIVELSEQTRRDNLQTFPAFGSIDAVPRHGVSMGIATITAARAGVMVLTGAAKRESLSRVLKAERYDPQWPATVIHEFAAGEILADREAAAGLG
ncbi:MAG: 6-phosphogluconolactonase [Gemmatimonadaceae bacterium]